MLSKLIRFTKNCNACSWHWSIEKVQFFCMTKSDHKSHNKCFRCLINKAMKFCLIYHIHLNSGQLTTISSSTSTFLQGKCLHNLQEAKNTARVHWIPKHRFLCYRRNKCISHWKKVLIVMVPILINKDMFEPSYNDLKFTVQTCNYFFANLISHLCASFECCSFWD